MKPFDQMEYHPVAEEVVQILCDKTQNPNPLFFRISVAYYFAVVASMMRATVQTHDRGDIPISLYALNLGTSGSGKGYSTNIMEEHVIRGFRERFLTETFPQLVEMNLPKLAVTRANRKNAANQSNTPLVDPDDELARVRKEFNSLGTLMFNFDSATTPAVKQHRHMLLMANAGSLNLQIDEIGSNLLSNIDVMTMFLELFDKGLIKPKLIKNTAENVRNEEIVGGTPTNMLLFGTPSKLLDGNKVEEELMSMLETGYARRCFFGVSRAHGNRDKRTPEEIYEMQTNQTSVMYLEGLNDRLTQLADMINVNKKLLMTKDTSLILIEYKQWCEEQAESLPDHKEVEKAEISHRYFKALKLAGAYAFIDDSPEVTEDHLYNAIKLAQASGEAFNNLLTRDKPYVKLAKYFGGSKTEVTHADLMVDLPFFKGTASQRQELLTLATAWGYRNNVIIKKSFSDGIEFLRGESLKITDLSSMIISYSPHIAYNYTNERVSFDELHLLTQANNYHWINHFLVANDKGERNRNEENCLPGFNLIVIDIDGTIQMDAAKLLLKDYKFHLYTTKSHTDQENRFRMVFPTNYELQMNAAEFKEFMANIYTWLPFAVDDTTGQRSRKWACHPMHYEYNDGQLFDVLPFIPKTSKNEERKKRLETQQQLDNLDRWYLNNTGDGNRNNMLLRYAMLLVDTGFNLGEIQAKVLHLNSQMADKLDDAELFNTVLKTVANRLINKP